MNAIEPHTGQVYLCLKGNKTQGTVKGKYYVYDSGEIRTYTSRNVTLLLNGEELLQEPGMFTLAHRCPFCCSEIVDSHDGVECAAEWDARTKKYCRDCNGDTVNGKCPKCE
jgi:hypothetical protein